MSLPILYSLRRCPYAMRARLGLLAAGQPVLIRDIVTKNKPPELFTASPKGTVPVLVVDDMTVIDESIDIILWALSKSDEQDLLRSNECALRQEIMELVRLNDDQFIPDLEQYRAASRYHDEKAEVARDQCLKFIDQIEQRLIHAPFLFGERISVADIALFPLISQFSRVDRKWFVAAHYKGIERWLTQLYNSTLYAKAMQQYPQWVTSGEQFLLDSSR